MAFDIAYQQRTAHMTQTNPSNSSGSSSSNSYGLNGTDSSNNEIDIVTGLNDRSTSERREMEEKEAHLGEKVAVGAHAVSDAILQLRCHAMKRQLDVEIGPERYADLSKVKVKNELNFNTLSNSSNQKSDISLTNKSNSSNSNSGNSSIGYGFEKESQEENALLCDILKEQLPPLPSDCNDSGSPALDLILSVLSTDSLTKGVRAMGMPQTYSYKKDIPSAADKERDRGGDDKELERDGSEVLYHIES